MQMAITHGIISINKKQKTDELKSHHSGWITLNAHATRNTQSSNTWNIVPEWELPSICSDLRPTWT